MNNNVIETNKYYLNPKCKEDIVTNTTKNNINSLDTHDIAC
jgi:hypothetical protein